MFHEIAGIPASCLGDDCEGTVQDCHEMWGDCTVFVCFDDAGEARASVTCGGNTSIQLDDRIIMQHTQEDEEVDFGRVAAIFPTGKLPLNTENASRKMEVWVWK